MAKTCPDELTFFEMVQRVDTIFQHLQRDGHYSESMFLIYLQNLCAKQDRIIE